MKSFLKLVFATVFGFFISLILIFFFFMGAAFSGSDIKSVDANSILYLKLSGGLLDNPVEDPFSALNPVSGGASDGKEIGLFELKKVLSHAAKDDKIKGILLNTDALSAGTANLFDLKRALEAFKKSGKFIVAYSDYSSEQSILLNNVADKYFLNPFGGAEFNGFGSELMFFTGLLEKLNIKPLVFYAGEFKSATEPFRLKQMSPENRLQYTELLNGIYNSYLKDVSASTKVSVDSLRFLADNLKIFKAEDALQAKLVDGLKYEDEVFAELKKKMGYKSSDDLILVTLDDYLKSFDIKKPEETSKNKIAVIYAEGEINDGEGDVGNIYADNYIKIIRKVAKDKEVKALVLRVNSPGGSAYASEVITRELQLLGKNIPIIVSMGDLAASGGYYISTAAKKIYAEPTTLTGSIGVFGMMFNISGALENKLGITTDRVKTSPYADFGSSTRVWDEKENALMTASVNHTYQTFLKRVADNRKMSIAQIDAVARGRVWTGEDALKHGLVDALGGLDAALAEAKKQAKLEKYELVTYPETKSFFETLMDKYSGVEEEQTSKVLKQYFGEDAVYFNMIRSLKNMRGVQARLPFEITIK